MTATCPIVWSDGAYDGDNRRLAMCGRIAVGAVFVPGARGRYYRWRAWCTARMNPAEGVERSEGAAKAEVERRFSDFLLLADLEPARRVA